MWRTNPRLPTPPPPLSPRPLLCSETRELNLTKLGQNLLAKEPQYFNRWPLPPVQAYLHAWPPDIIGRMLSGDAGAKVLLDASPQYLMNALAPARIRSVAPHAKFIMIVRVCPPALPQVLAKIRQFYAVAH